jgi:ribonuclease J
MNLTIHRGTQEIGGSCVELKTNTTRILIDFGLPLVSSQKDQPFDSKILKGKSVEELKNLSILPNIQGLYRNEKKEIDAVLISHSHMDHYGLLAYVNSEIPIYMSEGAKELIAISNIFTPNKIDNLDIKIFPKAGKTKIGEFDIISRLVDHSAFDARAFLIEAEGKRIFYSGDFRGHGRKRLLFQKIISTPPEKIDCLLMEGSMLDRGKQEFIDEEAVQKGIEDVLRNKNNIAFLFASSQNIDRIVSAYKACRRTNSILVIDIYTAYILQRLSKITKHLPQFDWQNIRVKFFKYHADKLAEAGYEKLLYVFNERKIEMAEIDAKKNNILMLLRDNSLFSKVVGHIHDIQGAIIIYSMWEGYLTEEFKNYCKNAGIEIKQVHTSGHATVEDLKAFARALKPRMLIPIHTFHGNKYKELFSNVKPLDDKEMLEI